MVEDLSGAIKTLMNTVNVKGALYFSTLTTLTLQEVRDAWQSLDKHPHVNPFLSLHDIEKACRGFIVNFLLKLSQNNTTHYMRSLLL